VGVAGTLASIWRINIPSLVALVFYLMKFTESPT
jgi:hypothetical protein